VTPVGLSAVRDRHSELGGVSLADVACYRVICVLRSHKSFPIIRIQGDFSYENR